MSTPSKTQIYLSRSVHIAEYLERQILSGLWIDRLPSERNLASYTGVGRDTIRAALKIMEQKGWQFQRDQKGTFATPPQKPSVPQDTSVGVLLPMKTHQTTHRTLLWIDELRKFLYHKSIQMQLYDNYYHTPRLMESLVREVSHHCWVIAYPNVTTQEWCVRTGVRGVVVGRVNRDITLPSVDLHYQAIHRHAVSRMIQLGHRDLVLILHRRHWESDIESQLGFYNAVESSSNEVKARVEFHDGTADGIRKTVDRLLTNPPVPTGWLVNVVPHFLTVMMHLLSKGIKIPTDLSLVSPDAEPWQSFATPEPTRYIANVQLLAKKTSLLVQNLINGAPISNERQYVMPVFHKGSTLDSPAQSQFQ